MKYNRILIDKIEQWAEWRNNSVPEVDYPSDTTESRLMEYGAIPSKGNDKVVPGYYGDNGARVTETAVFALPVPEHRVIWLRYVSRLSGDDIKKLTRLREAEYNMTMDMAHKLLAERLNIRFRD